MKESEIVQTRIDAEKQSASPEFYENVKRLCTGAISAIDHADTLEAAIDYCQDIEMELTFGKGKIEARWHDRDGNWRYVTGDRFLGVVNHVREIWDGINPLD